MSEFSKNLKKARINAGYKTARDFAKVLSISYDAYITYENKGREPRYDVLVEIAKKLQVTPNDLLGVPLSEECERNFNNGITEAFNYLTRAMQSIKDAHMSPYR